MSTGHLLPADPEWGYKALKLAPPAFSENPIQRRTKEPRIHDDRRDAAVTSSLPAPEWKEEPSRDPGTETGMKWAAGAPLPLC